MPVTISTDEEFTAGASPASRKDRGILLAEQGLLLTASIQRTRKGRPQDAGFLRIAE